MIKVEKINEVFVRIHCDISESMSLKDYLSCYIPNYRFHPKVKRKLWNGKVSFFDVRTHLLPIGLLPNFHQFCKTRGVEYKFIFDTSELYETIKLETVKKFAEKVLVTAYTSEGDKIDAYDYQINSVHKLIANKRGIILSSTGCHGKGTGILMYDGSTKKVEDINVNDKLMGNDGTERNVLSLITGKEQLYKVIPTRGNEFIVNENHILHIQQYKKKSINNIVHTTKENINISVKDYLEKNKYFKHCSKVIYNDKELTFNNNYKNTTKLTPYFIGMYLGDGNTHCCGITTMDSEIYNEILIQLKEYNADEKNIRISKKYDDDKNNKADTYNIRFSKGKRNPILKDFEKLSIMFGCFADKNKRTKCGDKFIPNEIKYGSIHDRYEVLAGLIDTDGHLNDRKTYYEFTSKSEKLVDDFIFVAKSLGFFIRKKVKYNKKYDRNYYRCNVQGNISKIPVRIERKKIDSTQDRQKKHNVFGFKVEPYKVDDFYGFQLDKNHLYFDENFLTHHNSGKSMILYLYVRMLLEFDPDINILLIVPTINLVGQLYQDFDDYGWLDVHNKCTRLCTGHNPDYKKQVLISTWQSLIKKPPKFFEKFDALIIDEVHNARNLSIKTISMNCINSDFRVGTTATLPSEPSELFTIFGYLGRVVYTVGSRELIDRGILSKIKIVNVILQYPKNIIDKNKNRAYQEEKETVQNYSPRNNIIRMIINNMPDSNNVLVLAQNVDHIARITEYLETVMDDIYTIISIHGKTSAELREEARQTVENGENVILVASFGTTSVGVNLRKIHSVIFASSYKSKIITIQAIGRGLRTHKTKDKLHLYDLIDDLTYKKRTGKLGVNHIFKHHLERMKYYKECGFECVKTKINI